MVAGPMEAFMSKKISGQNTVVDLSIGLSDLESYYIRSAFIHPGQGGIYHGKEG